MSKKKTINKKKIAKRSVKKPVAKKVSKKSLAKKSAKKRVTKNPVRRTQSKSAVKRTARKNVAKKTTTKKRSTGKVMAKRSVKKTTTKKTPRRKTAIVHTNKARTIKAKRSVKRTTRKTRSRKQQKGTIIKVVGVGGCGGNIATRLYESFPRGVEVIVLNTDVQDLEHCRAHKKLYIGKNTTRGLGAGMDPELGRQSAEENREEIVAALQGADMVFVTAGFGGGTGTGATPVVCEVAKELGILTIAVVTRPFSFEGMRRSSIAQEGVERLKDRVDTFILVSNDKIFSLIDRGTSLSKAFTIIDGILKNAVFGVAEMILSPGIVNVDFADIKYVMQHSGPAIIGVGVGNGKERALMAANAVLNSPLLETTIDGARGVLFSISGRKDVTMHEINEIAKVISENVDQSARIIFGAYYDRKISKGQLKVTLIATGFGSTYTKNYSLFEEYESESKNGIIFESGHVSQKVTEKEISPVLSESEKTMDEEEEKTKEEEETSLWDAPAFLRRKKRK